MIFCHIMPAPCSSRGVFFLLLSVLLSLSFVCPLPPCKVNPQAQNITVDYFDYDADADTDTDTDTDTTDRCVATTEDPTSDFECRGLTPTYQDCQQSTKNEAWGPPTTVFPNVLLPRDAIVELSWFQRRLLSIVDIIVQQEYNYCHHHALDWLPPEGTPYRVVEYTCQHPASKGICSSGGIDLPNAWRGVDCSSLTSWVYNFAFGAPLAAAIGQQACGPNSPGVTLPYTADDQDKFQPGDLVYVAASSTANPLHVTHVIIWTGYTMVDGPSPYNLTSLMSNMESCQVSAAQAYISARLSHVPPLPVYVVADSHNNGPRYRPFAGWYVSAFSHVRRIFGSSELAYPQNPPRSNYTKSACYNVNPNKIHSPDALTFRS